MIEYIKEIFTKPEIERSLVDNLVLCFIIIGCLLVLVAIVFLILTIIGRIDDKKKRKCKNYNYYCSKKCCGRCLSFEEKEIKNENNNV